MSKIETRDRILSAAEALFSHNGYDGTPVKGIAKEAGVTEMTLYNHFSNKELLYKTLIQERFLAIELETVFFDLTYIDLRKDLQTIAHGLMVNYRSNRNIMMMRIKERQSLMSETVFSMDKDPLVKLMIPVFEIYGERGLVTGTSRNNALLFATTMKGLFYVSLLDGKNEEAIKGLIDAYITTICEGFLSREAL